MGKRGPWLLVFRIAVSLLALAYVGWELSKHGADLARLWGHAWTLPAYAALGLSILLMPLNYLLEAEKWRSVVRSFYPELRLGRAFWAVLAGMASGIFTPNRVGEYAGRVLFLSEGKRVEAIVATFVDRVCQLLVTLVCGLLALGALVAEFGGGFLEGLLAAPTTRVLFLVFALAMGLVVFLFLAAPQHLARWLPQRWNSAVWIRKVRFALSQMPGRDIRRVVALSLLRYFVFSFQYVLLMWAFGYTGGLGLGLGIVALIFFGKSVLPVMGIFELGVRETVAVLVMGVFGLDKPMAVSSTFVLYVLNILLPTLLGILAVQRLGQKD
jgi:uncharacterized membrane protein YbhN (UPF0104 family)